MAASFQHPCYAHIIEVNGLKIGVAAHHIAADFEFWLHGRTHDA